MNRLFFQLAHDPALWHYLDATCGEGPADEPLPGGISDISTPAFLSLLEDTGIQAKTKDARGVQHCRLHFTAGFSPAEQDVIISALQNTQHSWLESLKVVGAENFPVGTLVEALSTTWPALSELSISTRLGHRDPFLEAGLSRKMDARNYKRLMRKIATNCPVLDHLELDIEAVGDMADLLSPRWCPVPCNASTVILKGAGHRKIQVFPQDLTAVFPNLQNLDIRDPWTFFRGENVDLECMSLVRALEELVNVEEVTYGVSSDKSIQGFLPLFLVVFAGRPSAVVSSLRVLRIVRRLPATLDHHLEALLDSFWTEHPAGVGQCLERIEFEDELCGEVFVSDGAGPWRALS